MNDEVEILDFPFCSFNIQHLKSSVQHQFFTYIFARSDYMNLGMGVYIRKAVKKDMVSVLDLITELAIYEKQEEQVQTTVADLERDAFGKNPLFHVLLAEKEGELAGMVFYYYGYSTWKGKMLYIDDIVVTERFRRFGVGQALFDYMRGEARRESANQIRFHVLNWNEPAVKFYKKNGVVFDDEWIQCKLEKENI